MTNNHMSEPVSRALDDIRSCSLLCRFSFAHPRVPGIWTSDCAAELMENVVDVELAESSLVDFLRVPFARVSQSAAQLLLDLAWLQLFMACPDTPFGRRWVLKELNEPVYGLLPGDLDDALELGLAPAELRGGDWDPAGLRLLIRFAHAWLSMPTGNSPLLSDPVAYQDFVESLEADGAELERRGLLVLGHPASFGSVFDRTGSE